MEFNCSGNQIKVLERIYSKDEFIDSEAISVVLVALGVKPGAAVSLNVADDFEELVSEILEIRQMPERDFLELEEAEKGYLLSRSSERFELMKESYDAADKFRHDLGIFCGYPEEDVEWFVNEFAGKKQIEEFFSDIEDIDMIIDFALYIPRKNKKSIRRARKTAEKHIEALEKMDEEFNTDLGRRIIESLRQHQD